jgi:hypothetical protein
MNGQPSNIVPSHEARWSSGLVWSGLAVDSNMSAPSNTIRSTKAPGGKK